MLSRHHRHACDQRPVSMRMAGCLISFGLLTQVECSCLTEPAVGSGRLQKFST